MARPRTYEPSAALDRAMHLFWKKGYESTSMADLVEATGVSRYGFYSELGDKDTLFARCLSHYTRTVIAETLAPMEQPDASLAEIRAYFEHMRTAVRRGNRLGCLIGNTAVSGAGTEGRFGETIEQHYARLRAAFENALTNAVQEGTLSSNRAPDVLADYLVGVVNGCLASLRANVPQSVIEHYLEVALEALA